MKKNNKLSFEKRLGWFLLSLTVMAVGMIGIILFPGELDNPFGVIFIIGLILFIHSFFAKKSIYKTFK